MGRKKGTDARQVDLFPTTVSTEKPSELEKLADSSDIKINHGKNFRITQVYLLLLNRHNQCLRYGNMTDELLEHDNLLLRDMFGGIKNSLGTPPQIFDGLNAAEIVLMEAGIYKRKFLYPDDMFIRPKGDGYRHAEPIKVKRKLENYSTSRIATKGHLGGKSLYEIMMHLLTATEIGKLHKLHKSDWKRVNERSYPNDERKKYTKLNPYDPETLKERMDLIEITHPQVLGKFKEVLTNPFIPEKRVLKDRNGNPTKVINPTGFETPGKTYKKGVKGMSFYRLKEYAKEVAYYFESKERLLSSK